MELSIYLFREEITSLDGLVQHKHLQGASAFVKLIPSEDLPYECVAYIQKNKIKEPRWLKFLSTHLQIECLRLQNATNSFECDRFELREATRFNRVVGLY